MPTGIRRIGAHHHDIRVGRLDRPHDRREIGLRRRIAAVVDDAQAERLGVFARAVGGVARELLVGGDDRHRLRLRALLHRDVEEALGEGGLRVRPRRDHHEIVRVVELGVDREAEQPDERLLLLDDDRHGRRQHGGGVGADDQLDLVDVEQLRVDARHGRRVALVVVVDELDRPAEQPALGIDVLLPDLLGEQRGLAVGREPAGQRHAVADLDRLAGRRLRRQRAGAQGRSRKDGAEQHSFGLAPTKHRFLRCWADCAAILCVKQGRAPAQIVGRKGGPDPIWSRPRRPP